MVDFVPVDHDPFDGSGPLFAPVDHDPFAIDPLTGAPMAPAPAAQSAFKRIADHYVSAIKGWLEFPMNYAKAKAALDSGEMTEGESQREFDLRDLEKDRLRNAAADWAAGTAFGLISPSRAPIQPATLASRSARLYSPPDKPARPFSADYPQAGPTDAAGRLLTDIEGRALGADRIVGRRTLGGADEALAPAELDAAGAAILGRAPAPVPASALPRNAVGAYREHRGPDGPERRIDILANLEPRAKDRVTAHELGHAVDELSGQIPTQGLSAELRQVYNTLNTGQERTRNLTGPRHFGYSPDDVPRELIAEAVRAYMADPNYLKTVAPKTAAAIRAAVNNNPRLNRAIQFNVGSGNAGSAAAAPLLVPTDDASPVGAN